MSCGCNSCVNKHKEILKKVKKEWDEGKRKIEFKPYYWECGDGCCSDSGTKLYINDFLVDSDGENIESVLKTLMNFLNIENVSIEYSYEDYED